jgi:hypothetical protein
VFLARATSAIGTAVAVAATLLVAGTTGRRELPFFLVRRHTIRSSGHQDWCKVSVIARGGVVGDTAWHQTSG